MAERCIPTALLFAKASEAFKTGTTAAFAYLGCSKESMAAYDVDTTTFGTEITRVAVTPAYETITKTNDTVVMDKDAWTVGAYTLYGAGVFIGLADSTLQIFHEWPNAITFGASDQIRQTIKIQSKQGA